MIHPQNSIAPVLFLVFNRPEETRRVFEAIRQARPRRLYVAADGPRISRPTDVDACNEVREIIKLVDWECQLFTLIRTENIGCKYAVSSAIDWFFEHEESGIILEDDTLPSQSFFSYCSELLKRYHDDSRVMKIAGFNVLGDDYSYAYDYFFTNFSFTWGWATWRRAWVLNDLELKNLPLVKKLTLDKYYPFNKERNFCFEQANNGLDTWDYQWDFTMACQSGLQIVPRISLIQNIGFNASATHTKSDVSQRGLVFASELTYPLVHPPAMVLVNHHYEKLLFKRIQQEKIQERIVFLCTKFKWISHFKIGLLFILTSIARLKFLNKN